MLHEWEVAVSKRPCVYILASDRNGTLYIGVTSDLEGRVSTHLQDLLGGFTAKHRVHRLVYYEMHESMDAAILREKRLKKWKSAMEAAPHRKCQPGVARSIRSKTWRHS